MVAVAVGVASLVRARVKLRWGLLVSIAAATLCSCVRPAEHELCPDVGAGALVLTELLGPQSDTSPIAPWIELGNVSDDAVDLQGTHIRQRKLDGSDEREFIVREPLEVDADDFATIDVDLHAAGLIEIVACEATIDAVVYRELPGFGTWSLGSAVPSASANDHESAWCRDDTTRAATTTGEHTRLGTPGEANRPCD